MSIVLLPAQSQNWLVTLDALGFVLPNGIFKKKKLWRTDI